jgi:hypothetical protein
MNELLDNSVWVVPELGERQSVKWIVGFCSWSPERSCHGCNFRLLVSGKVLVLMKTISGRQRVFEAETSMASMDFSIRIGIHFVQSLNRTPIKACHDAAVNVGKSTGSGNLPDQRRSAPGMRLVGQIAGGNQSISCSTYTCFRRFSARLPGMNEIESGLPGRLNDGLCRPRGCRRPDEREHFILCEIHTSRVFDPVRLSAMTRMNQVTPRPGEKNPAGAEAELARVAHNEPSKT